MIDRLSPSEGVEIVHVTDEDEYFPPPRELRDLMPALDSLVALVSGASPRAAREQGGPFGDDRATDASHTLASLSTG